MPIWDNSPQDWGNSFGQLVLEGNARAGRRYQITPTDAVILGTAANEEDAWPLLIMWAIAWRYGARPTFGQPNGFKRQIELYCAPINPAFFYDGSPVPERSVMPCNQIGNQRVPCTGGPGRLPPAHPTRIPGAPDCRTYSRVMCTMGAAKGVNTRDMRLRATRYENMRTAMFGSS